jgi:hypothetical protein
MPGAPSSLRQPRLNPFAFPSDTSLRFGLLLIFAVTGAASSFRGVWSLSHDTENKSSWACANRLITGFYSPAITPKDADSYATAFWNEMLPEWVDCARLLRPAAVFSVVGVILTIGLALVLYWALPLWRIRKRRLQPITAHDPPGLLDELHRLCGEAGLPRPPLFVWNHSVQVCPSPSADGAGIM